MSHSTRLRRQGFTLIEILVSLAILGIIGAGFVRLIVTQSNFTEKQMAGRNARTVSRNAMNIMLTDLRMVQDRDGLIFAKSDSITVRVPVAFGLICSTGPGATISLLPVDSAMTELAQYDGWAYRDDVSGQYVYADANQPRQLTTLSAGNAATCAAGGITPMTITPSQGQPRTGRVVSVPNPDTPAGVFNVGGPAFLYQQITYAFDSSAAFPASPKRIGLWRTVRTSNNSPPVRDEIIAPFDNSARFRFYVLNADAATDAVPADLNTVRGLELVLAGSSPRIAHTDGNAMQALVTGVFFKNRRDP